MRLYSSWTMVVSHWESCAMLGLYEESKALVTGGVFHISRNPMYLGMTLILLGVALILGSATPFVVVLLFPVLLDRIFIVPEERMLEDTFSYQFRQYRNHVRRWI